MTTCPPSAPLDPRVRRTRKLLQDALGALMHEKRFASISIQEIAARATVNRATFYAHYPDKETLAASILHAGLQAALQSASGARFAHPATVPALCHESLVEFAVVFFTFLGTLTDACPETALDLHATVGATLQAHVDEIMEHWLSDRGGRALRQFPPGSHPETVASVLSWSLYGEAIRWSRQRSRSAPEPLCREIVSLLLPPPVLDHALQ